jgi:HK97 family phage portal protein
MNDSMATKRKNAQKKSGKSALAPRISQKKPDSGSLVPMPRKVAGLYVNEATALSCASVWACVRVISEGLAKLPWPSYKRRDDGGRERAAEQPADWLLNIQSNPETSAYTLRETLIVHALTWGNGYAEVERDLLGRPVWLWQLTPDRVHVDRDSRGRIVYDVSNSGEPNTTLYEPDVYHLKGLGFDGLVGYSVIQMHARTIGGGLAADKAANDLWENDTTPGGLLEHPGRLSDKSRQNLIDSWTRRHAGNRRMLGILEEGMKWSQTSLPPEDLQLLETRQFTPLEICRIFRVQPHKIAELTRATFSNIEEQSREHVEDSLMPWAVRMEQEANIKLFLPNAQRRFYTKHNFKALLRGNAMQRSDFYTKMFQLGMSLNEIFELEDMNPIGPDGDKRFVPMNLQLLEKAGEEPEVVPGAVPIPVADDDDAENDEDEAQAAQMFPLVEDLCGRILRREATSIADGAKKNGDFEVWLQDFAARHESHLRNELTPAAKALCPDRPEALVVAFLGLYLPEMVDRCRRISRGEDAKTSAAECAHQFIAAARAANIKRIANAG